VVLVALVSLAVGVGVGWLAFAPDEGGQATQGQAADESNAAAKQEALAVMNTYVAAWNAGDGDAVVSLMDENGLVGVVRPAEYRPYLDSKFLRSEDVARWEIWNLPERSKLVKLVGKAKGMFGEQPEVADVLWMDLSTNDTGGPGSLEAWALIEERSGTFNPIYYGVIRFTFNFGDDFGITPTVQPYIWSAEHILRSWTAEVPGFPTL
jgi:hypothetical protein